jgi:hypothetical protein
MICNFYWIVIICTKSCFLWVSWGKSAFLFFLLNYLFQNIEELLKITNSCHQSKVKRWMTIIQGTKHHRCIAVFIHGFLKNCLLFMKTTAQKLKKADLYRIASEVERIILLLFVFCFSHANLDIQHLILRICKSKQQH